MKDDEHSNELKILCPFCNAPYTAQMEEDLDVSMRCETCGPGPIMGAIFIICDNCKRTVYKKEI